MKKGFVIAGLMLATVFASCEKDRIEDNIDLSTDFKIESISVSNDPSAKNNDNLVINMNGESFTAVYTGEETFVENTTMTGGEGTRKYTFPGTQAPEFGATDLLLVIDVSVNAAGKPTVNTSELIFTNGTDTLKVVAVGDLAASGTGLQLALSYDGKGSITENTFFTQNGEIDLAFTINVTLTPPTSTKSSAGVHPDAFVVFENGVSVNYTISSWNQSHVSDGSYYVRISLESLNTVEVSYGFVYLQVSEYGAVTKLERAVFDNISYSPIDSDFLHSGFTQNQGTITFNKQVIVDGGRGEQEAITISIILP